MPPPSRNRGWLWYFLILVVLTIAATGILVVYNLGQQLKPEELEAARKLWDEKGPANYTLVYKTKNKDDEEVTYRVKVREKKTVEATFSSSSKNLSIDKEQLGHYGMHGLFVDVERFMEIDQKKGARRIFCRAIFDPETGAIRWYVRRVMGSTERLEITVEKLEKE
jgi:hypothetical protein